MNQTLPTKPSLVYLKKQAKDLLEAHRAGQASDRFAPYFTATNKVGLAQAQLVLAREYGFESWNDLRKHVERSAKSDLEALISAALDGEIPEARKLLADGVGAQDLVTAALSGDVDRLRMSLQTVTNTVNSLFGPKKATLLWYACHSGLIQDKEFEPKILGVVDLLLKSGADPNAVVAAKWGGDDWGDTALYGAAGQLNHPGLTKLLLDAGADPNDGAIDGDTYRGESLYHACDHPGKNECLKLLLQANPAQIAKDYCIKRKLDFEDIEGVKLFLEYGANPNATKLRTALGHAILRGRSIAIIQLLLDAGANPNQKEEDGTTPYTLSRRLGNHEVSALLEKHGAKADFGLHDQVLIAAVEGDRDRMKQLLAEHPEVMGTISEHGRQPSDGVPLGAAGHVLHDLARLGNAKALESLLEVGVDPGFKNQWNETPLHWACVAGRADAARVLLKFGAPLDTVEMNHNCVPIDWAYWGSQFWNEPFGDYPKTVEVMLDGGCPLPDGLKGSEAVQALLKERGVI